MSTLNSRTVLMSGGSRGIGLAIAERLAADARTHRGRDERGAVRLNRYLCRPEGGLRPWTTSSRRWTNRAADTPSQV